MEVDPDILRAFAGQVDIASARIREADVGTKVATAADGLDGSTTQWAVGLVGAHVKTIAGRIATGVSDLGAAVRGAGNTYEVTDAVLAGRFEGIF
ncbi:type VII secretion target [Mycobacterium sp. NAZ190054]|uniref:type VII secretion target n=1 Tax=Mycobacterium sp. NAZ190054 TaxID=1747766 RepID=UPI0009EAAED4|nr:type VII secretion target [Mycobacterium sp. NAZ190054]